MEYITNVVCAAVLAACAIQDLRCKMINIIVPVAAVPVIIVVKLLSSEETITGIILSLSPGIIMMFISLTGGEILGLADGIIVCFVGICEGACAIIAIIALSFAIAWLVILYKIIVKRNSVKNIVIPFVPCIIPGWLCVCAGRCIF